MSMVIVVAVVIAQNASIVQWTPLQIDVSQAIAGYFAGFEPNLLLEHHTFSFSLEAMFLHPRGSNWRLSWTHGLIVSQIGLQKSLLIIPFARGGPFSGTNRR